MNTYRYVFACKCPSDDETIIYGLEVRSKEMIRVEAIKDACAEWTTGFQEAIAADLRDVLGAAISLRAQHQGVEIVTELRAALASQPGCAAEGEAVLTPDQIEVLQFLYGIGTLRGCGFGEKPESERGNYWWRSNLRAAFPGIPALQVNSTEMTKGGV